jgi:hypothetical protein
MAAATNPETFGDTKMKMYTLALAALAAASSISLAGERPDGNRNHDLRDSDTYSGKYSNRETSGGGQAIYLLEAEGVTAADDREQRRLDEKSEGSFR